MKRDRRFRIQRETVGRGGQQIWETITDSDDDPSFGSIAECRHVLDSTAEVAIAEESLRGSYRITDSNGTVIQTYTINGADAHAVTP